jgi:WD40 repeat protein
LLAGGPLPPPSATRIEGHRGAVLALGAARNERSFVSGGADGAVKLWDTRAAVALREVGMHGAPVRAAIILPDGGTALAGDDRGAIVWRALPEGETLHAFDVAQAGRVLALAVDAQGRRLTRLHETGPVIVWDLAARMRVATLAADGARQRAQALSADGARAVTGGEDGALRVWNVADARLEWTLSGHAGAVRSVALTPDGLRAVSGGDDATARLWDVASGAELRRFASLKGPFHTVPMLAHGRFAVGADDGAIRLFDAEGREPMLCFPAPNR